MRNTIRLTAADLTTQARAYRRQGNEAAADTMLSLAWWLGFGDAAEEASGATWAEWAGAITITKSYEEWAAIRWALQTLAMGSYPTPALFDLPDQASLRAFLIELERGVDRELERGPRSVLIAPVDFAMAYLRCREAGGASWAVAAFARSRGICFTRKMFSRAREYLTDYEDSPWPTECPAPAPRRPRKAA
jgi:hypothetical protein